MILPNILPIYQEVVDSILESVFIGKECKLYYETKEKCNCEGICEECDGTGNVYIIKTTRIRIYNKNKVWSETAGIQFVDGRCQIIGYAADVVNIKQCSYLKIEDRRFKLATEPLRHGFGSRYFTAYVDLIK